AAAPSGPAWPVTAGARPAAPTTTPQKAMSRADVRPWPTSLRGTVVRSAGPPRRAGRDGGLDSHSGAPARPVRRAAAARGRRRRGGGGAAARWSAGGQRAGDAEAVVVVAVAGVVVVAVGGAAVLAVVVPGPAAQHTGDRPPPHGVSSGPAPTPCPRTAAAASE